MKRCIFYLPYQLEEQENRARMVRPRKMIRALHNVGYEVYEITGFAKDRRERITELKKRIASGEIYEFMYFEASTMPTLLTEPHHFPTHPFLDYGFFHYLKRHGIKIGLFYPDIYWKFENYGKELPRWQRYSAIMNYKLDIWEYEKVLNRFYVPTLDICKYLKSESLGKIAEELPPGADDIEVNYRDYSLRDFRTEPLTVFYVGGLGNHYQISELAAAVANTPNTRFILCCREKEWEKEKSLYNEFINEQIEVIHKSGSELEAYYLQADVGSLLFKGDRYMEMAKPVKAFEYLAHEIPLLATKGTAIGAFSEENNTGWTIKYDRESIQKQLTILLENPFLIEEKRKCCRDAKEKNTWEMRAKQVANGLSNG